MVMELIRLLHGMAQNGLAIFQAFLAQTKPFGWSPMTYQMKMIQTIPGMQ